MPQPDCEMARVPLQRLPPVMIVYEPPALARVTDHTSLARPDWGRDLAGELDHAASLVEPLNGDPMTRLGSRRYDQWASGVLKPQLSRESGQRLAAHVQQLVTIRQQRPPVVGDVDLDLEFEFHDVSCKTGEALNLGSREPPDLAESQQALSEFLGHAAHAHADMTAQSGRKQLAVSLRILRSHRRLRPAVRWGPSGRRVARLT